MPKVFMTVVKVLWFHRRDNRQWILHVENMVHVHAQQSDGFVLIGFELKTRRHSLISLIIPFLV